MAKEKNKEVVETLRKKVANAKSIVFTDYLGLKANDINDLRSTMRANEAEVVVAKNTLLKLALKAENIEAKELSKDLEGPTAAIFSYNDPVLPIKALFDFIKKIELPKVKSAIFSGVYNSADEIETISKLPSREQLVAQVVGGLKSPLNGMVGVLNGVQRKLVYALAAVAAKKQ